MGAWCTFATSQHRGPKRPVRGGNGQSRLERGRPPIVLGLPDFHLDASRPFQVQVARILLSGDESWIFRPEKLVQT